MKSNKLAALRPVISAIFFALAASAAAHGQNTAAIQNGRAIEGTWNMQVQWRTCDNNTPQLLPTPDLRTFARGGTMSELNSSIWCDTGHCASLGAWRHVAGRRYLSTYKRFRVNPDTDQSVGYVIVNSSILYDTDDRLATTETLRFYDNDGDLEATRCRTATGTRLVVEN